MDLFSPPFPSSSQQKCSRIQTWYYTRHVLRLLSSVQPPSLALASQRSIHISNDLYGSDIFSAFKMANGFTLPSSNAVQTITNYLLEVQTKYLAIVSFPVFYVLNRPLTLQYSLAIFSKCILCFWRGKGKMVVSSDFTKL